ncbi:MAG: carbamoyl phosphate synthase small subunit [Oscillospiraceae bacterium]|nr:carbamoyl phosphate synthase small subunit [Oscillospiraceae bacterium]
MKAYLSLEDGTVFEGKSFGSQNDAIGEIVFTTGVVGYLETLTDPSYYGQIILQTFPLIGNYGIIPADFESSGISASAYIVKDPCHEPSNFRSEGTLDSFLKENGVVGLYGIDTRALTKIIREKGVMNGKITMSPPTDADCADAQSHAAARAVASVSSSTIEKLSDGSHRIALMDFGAKRGISKQLMDRDCEVWSFPYDTPANEIMKTSPQGIMLSNGPGDPADPANKGIVDVVRALSETGVPIFGICLGHQFLAMAHGYKTTKLKFGHRGANQPVKDLRTGRTFITSQNHGYAVVGGDNSSFINVNDGTNEGMDYGASFSVQFHPEACGGPLDTAFLFDRFIERLG